MKKYKVEGINLHELLRKVAAKLNTTENKIGYNMISEDKISGKIVLEVWVIEERAPEAEEIIKMNISKDGVFLKINNGDIDLNDVINFIAEKDIQDPDIEKINEAYYSRGKEIKIADYFEGFYREAEIDIEMSEDKMEGYIYIVEPKGVNLPAYEAIKKMIEDKITFGFKEELLKEALRERKYNYNVVIAKGASPIHGKDAYIKYHIKSIDNKNKLKPSMLEDGRVDFKSLDIVENVKAGQLLAEKVPAEKGIPGKNLLGNIVEAKDGKDCLLPVGKNTQISEDGLKVTSKIDGMVVYKDKKISIADIYVVNDVGLATGNINFSGSVLIKGDVSSDYTVEAEGNIEVKGNFEKAYLKSKGDIIARGSIFGKGAGKLEAKGDIIVNFAEAAIIEAEGNVIANEAIMHSNIFCGKKVSVIDRKGVLVGGDIMAAEGIEVINLGSAMSVKTEVEVGINPKLLEEYKAIEAEHDEVAKKLDQIEKNLNVLQKLKATLKENMPKEKEDLLVQLLKAKFSITKHIHDQRLRMEELDKEMNDVKHATVDVHGICYPGVKIKIRKGAYFVNEKIQNARFYYDEGTASVKFTALK